MGLDKPLRGLRGLEALETHGRDAHATGMQSLCRSRRAFTLIELLVVIAIIALLVSILMPGLSKVRLLAKRAVCASQMRNLSLAVSFYRAEFNDRIPIHIGNDTSRIPSWRFLLARDGGVSPAIFDCPSASFRIVLPTNIQDPRLVDDDKLTAHPLFGNNRKGSLAVMLTRAYQGGIPGNELGGLDQAYHNSTSYPSDVAWRPEVGWQNPLRKLYLADAYSSQMGATYPSLGLETADTKASGTNHITQPSDGGYLLPNTAGHRRFADRHVGTNALMINGAVMSYKTQDLDAMTNKADPNNIWTTGR